MSNHVHSSGPWDIDETMVVDSHGRPVADIDTLYTSAEIQDANRKLISRGPTMAELLEDLVAYYGGDYSKHRDLHHLIADVKRELARAGL